MPYERREHPVPRAINYHRVYSRKNWRKRWELRSIYERILLRGDFYTGAVIRAAPNEFDERTHMFYLNGDYIASIEIDYPVFKPTLHFVRTDYNKFRLFLRNIGIKATGRKHITTIRLPTGESLRFDHLKSRSYSYPPIRFLLGEEGATELLHTRLYGPVSRTGAQLQQNTFTITWDSQRGTSFVRREPEHQVISDSLQTQPGSTRRLSGSLNQETSSEGNTLRPPDTQQVYPLRSTPTLPVTDQQIWD